MELFSSSIFATFVILVGLSTLGFFLGSINFHQLNQLHELHQLYHPSPVTNPLPQRRLSCWWVVWMNHCHPWHQWSCTARPPPSLPCLAPDTNMFHSYPTLETW